MLVTVDGFRRDALEHHSAQDPRLAGIEAVAAMDHGQIVPNQDVPHPPTMGKPRGGVTLLLAAPA